ncbi:hypothetical protein O181_035041 [Austropuccinia psidii MF-1]|uniref:Uncharacterized protein n=1 Tax=Austropuccinia psidii MF-1 TaxID=1389203 RepID=A0A9Q3H8L1_9BASI|nr:hypothetical protein [Austropuccinia psidii MF-1]
MDKEIQLKCPTFVSETNTIGCMAHIIHLAASDGLKALAHANEPTQTGVQQPPEQLDLSNIINEADGLNLNYDSIISQIAHLGSYLSQSLQCQENFITMASQKYEVAPMTPTIMAMTGKLSKYLQILLWKTPVICATILDPCFKHQGKSCINCWQLTSRHANVKHDKSQAHVKHTPHSGLTPNPVTSTNIGSPVPSTEIPHHLILLQPSKSW